MAKLTHLEINRFSRHLILPDVGITGQQKLKDSAVLCIGAGGLGSPVLMYLAAAGIGRIGIVDYDVVDVTNLQRQIIHGTKDVGRPKIDSAADRLADINPHLIIDKYEVPFTSANALEIIESYDLVVDGTDNFPTRYLVNDACVITGKPNVYGSIFRFEGQLSVFGAPEGPCYRCLFPEPPPRGLVPSCAEGGVLGLLPGTIGAMQATEAVKLLLGIGRPMIGRLMIYDALEMDFMELKVEKKADCPVCGENPTVTELIDYEQFCGMPAHDHSDYTTGDSDMFGKSTVPGITVHDLKARLDAGEKIRILDVREPHEWDITNLEKYGSFLIPKDAVVGRADELDREVTTVIQCRSGGRSADVIRWLQPLGFNNLLNLEGGINLWAKEIEEDMPTY
ncbi:MAG: molybdopterin/thiamine biosynthesis adenylyltransferase/rhodanese-related sulfurtransferase [Cellvibrionaceae bacterium]|jgi:molybdopterin/thiamine biosynthesis adenylyltransferase/rhodanese-related sulfurtransferase